MIIVQTGHLIWLTHELGRLGNTLNNIANDLDKFRSPENKENDKAVFTAWKDSFAAIGLKLSSKQCERIAYQCETNDVLSHQDMAQMVRELANRMEDECAQIHFISVDERENSFINPTAPLLGNDVEDKIPNVIEDISEAGKCIGYGRSTAGVFHLMRVMEAGLQRLGGKLSVDLVEHKVWQVILDQVNMTVKKLPPKDATTVKYAEIAAQLYHVKLAWRNEVMHPKATYTDEEAAGIFGAVRSFMRDLADVL